MLLLGVLFLFPILPNAVQTIAIILFALTTLKVNKKFFKTNLRILGWKPLLINSGWYLLLCLTLFYSDSIEKGSVYILRGISLIGIPLLVFYFFPKLTQRQMKFAFSFFIIAHLVLFFFIYHRIIAGIDTIGYINEQGLRIRGLASENWLSQFKIFIKMPFSVSRYYLNENEVSTFFLHKAYLSMGYLWCVCLMAYDIVNFKRSTFVIVFSVLIVILFLLAVIYFTSVPNLFLLVVLMSLAIIFFLKRLKHKIVFLFLFATMIYLFSQTETFKHKILGDERLVKGVVETKKLFHSFVSGHELDGSNIRGQVWQCAYQAIGESFFWGYGVGSEGKVLKDCYDSSGCKSCSEYVFNAHNQFATMMLNGGVLLLLAFLIALGQAMLLSIKSKSYLFMLFLLLFTVNLMGESMLVRIHGILFYTLFGSVFISNALKANSGISSSKRRWV